MQKDGLVLLDCELRGAGRSLGRGNSLLLPRDPWVPPHLWLPWLVPCDSSSSLGCFPPLRAAQCQGNLVCKENKQMPARWQCATCEELALASHLHRFHPNAAAPPLPAPSPPQHQQEFVPEAFLKVSETSARAEVETVPARELLTGDSAGGSSHPPLTAIKFPALGEMP